MLVGKKNHEPKLGRYVHIFSKAGIRINQETKTAFVQLGNL